MEPKYGQIIRNTKMNQAIYDCFDFLNEKEQRKFVKKFKDLPHVHIQTIHTFSELLLGTYLSATGLIVENERKINGKTPDWSILDSSGEILAIVEMVYHHIDWITNDSLLAQSNVEGNSYSYFPNANDPEHQRLFSQIEGKACKYRNLVTDLQIPYVIAIFIDFLVEIDTEVIKNCLMKGEKTLFNTHTGVSGVLYFEEYFCGSYRFNYIDNPFAIREMYIPSGVRYCIFAS